MTENVVMERAALEDRVIVVSLMKSGTHLIQELMIALGYGIYGTSRVPSGAHPTFSPEHQARILELVHGKHSPEDFGTTENEYAAAAAKAWHAYGWSWQIRFGLPLVSHYGVTVENQPLIEQAKERTAGTSFSETPPGICWILPELDVTKADGRFLADWTRTGHPKIIFMYRDPRDTVLSMVNFLMGETGRGFGAFSDFTVFHEILKSKKDLGERLDLAFGYDAFPGVNDHDRMRWLLHHPGVCKVSFEELVGERGGGSADGQRRAVARVAEFVGHRGDPAKISAGIFRRDSFTFFKGRIGSWRSAFEPRHVAAARERFGTVLGEYGYE